MEESSEARFGTESRGLIGDNMRTGSKLVESNMEVPCKSGYGSTSIYPLRHKD